MIRTLNEADAEVFFALRLRALAEEPEAFGEAADAFRGTPRGDLAARLRPSDDRFILGAFAPDLIGTVGFARERGAKRRHIATIWGMYVAPETRGQGLGRALISEALARAAALPDLEQVYLTVVTTNTTAASLYHSLGFTVYGTERRALKIGDRYVDEELMALSLRG